MKSLKAMSQNALGSSLSSVLDAHTGTAHMSIKRLWTLDAPCCGPCLRYSLVKL